jgi:diguanylate cyclase (GGDEF)-like protein
MEIKRALLYAGLEPEEYMAAVPDARMENQKVLPMYTTGAIVVFAGLFFLSGILGVNFTENRWVYLAMMLVNLVLYLCATKVLERCPSLTGPLALCFVAALYEFAFFIALNHPDMPAVTPVALLLVIPYFFDFRPIYEIALTICAATLYCLLSFQMNPYLIAIDDLWNMGVFAVVACIVSVVQARMKFRLIHHARVNRYLSETDILTNVRNRNAYEHRLDSYGEQCSHSVACVYADVNGLHEINNAQGHAAGDRMLQTVAQALKKRFGAEHTYRIGGDEFVAMQMDASLEDLQPKVESIRKDIVAAGYYTSFGVAVHQREDIDMTVLVRAAESEMYVDKHRYYSQANHDRRRSRCDNGR